MKGVLRSTMPIALLLLLAAALVSVTSGERTAAAPASDFIRLSCRSTLYPALCVQSLSSYGPTVRRSPRQLATAALAVSADRARDATTYVGRMSGGPRASRSRDGGALRDCMETLSDSVDRLQRSVRELSRPGRRGTARFRWRVSNVKTWVSAALTDQNTCLESLNEDKAAVVTGGARAAIRRKILDVAHVTSNALALVNRMAGGN